MNQINLDRAVARATGESIRLIRNMGFSFVETPKRASLPCCVRKHAKLRTRLPATASR